MPFLTTNHFFLFFGKSWLVVSEVNIYFPLTYQVVCRKEKLDQITWFALVKGLTEVHQFFCSVVNQQKKKTKQQHENKVDKLTSLHLQ